MERVDTGVYRGGTGLDGGNFQTRSQCRFLPHLTIASADGNDLVQEQELAPRWPTCQVQMPARRRAHGPLAQVWARHARHL